MSIEKVKGPKSQGTDQIPAELKKEGGRIIRSEVYKLIDSICNKEFLEQWKESIILTVYKKGDKADCSDYNHYSLPLVCFITLR
jgi:hypothetical protein